MFGGSCCSATGGGIRSKSIPQELIDRYKRGETHAVSALYQLSQVLQFQVELKETVTTGTSQTMSSIDPPSIGSYSWQCIYMVSNMM